MPKFASASAAYEFYFVTIGAFRSGRAQIYDPDFIGALGVSLNYRICEAIDIQKVIDVCDRKNGRESWLADYYNPEPTNPPPAWTCQELLVLNGVIRRFECGLCAKRIIDRQHGERDCRKKKKVIDSIKR